MVQQNKVRPSSFHFRYQSVCVVPSEITFFAFQLSCGFHSTLATVKIVMDNSAAVLHTTNKVIIFEWYE